MLRHESYPFFERLLTAATLEEVAGYLYSLKERLSEKKGKKEENEQLKQLLQQADIKDPALVEARNPPRRSFPIAF